MQNIFHPGLWNAWWFSLPMILGGLMISIFRNKVAKRMADLTGYNFKEKAITVIASLTPYPFIIYTVGFGVDIKNKVLLIGAIIYLLGLIIYLWSLLSFASASLEKIICNGVYRYSRNPMYLSALMMFLGIVIMMKNEILLVYWVVMVMLHHYMILAEERICKSEYGEEYVIYYKKVPRYMLCIPA